MRDEFLERWLENLNKADLVPEGLVLIVEVPTGQFFKIDTNGVNLTPSLAEGVLIKLVHIENPLNGTIGNSAEHWYGGPQEKQLHEFFTGPKIRGAGGPIDSEDVDLIERILAQSERTRFLTIDRAQPGNSYEAWLKVIISKYPTDAIEEFGNKLPPLPAVGFLTWQNSD